LVFTAIVTRMRPTKWPAAWWKGSFAIACRESPRPGFGDYGPTDHNGADDVGANAAFSLWRCRVVRCGSNGCASKSLTGSRTVLLTNVRAALDPQ
jgi:hypothetical protein